MIAQQLEELEALRFELRGDGTPLEIAVQRREMWLGEYRRRIKAEAVINVLADALHKCLSRGADANYDLAFAALALYNETQPCK
jgi:hypothetical protein